MTTRDFYTTIINADLTAILEDEMAKSVKEHAEAGLRKLDETNEKRRNAPSKKELENLPLMKQVVNEVLSFEPMTASDIGAAIGVNHNKLDWFVSDIKNLDEHAYIEELFYLHEAEYGGE